MTETVEVPNFDIKERVVQTGYVGKDGRFVPTSDELSTGFAQTGEDVVAD